MKKPLTRPIRTTPPSASNSAEVSEVPSFSIWRYQATDMAMMATAERSIPRPMMTTAMPTARMPSTLTLRTMATRLSTARNPWRVSAAAMNSATASAKTMRSWLILRIEKKLLTRPPCLAGVILASCSKAARGSARAIPILRFRYSGSETGFQGFGTRTMPF